MATLMVILLRDANDFTFHQLHEENGHYWRVIENLAIGNLSPPLSVIDLDTWQHWLGKWQINDWWVQTINSIDMLVILQRAGYLHSFLWHLLWHFFRISGKIFQN